MATATTASVSELPANTVFTTKSATVSAEQRWLIASPYVDQAHLLDLDTLDPQSRLFAIALSKLHLASSDYAIVKYEAVFDFAALMTELNSLAQQAGVSWQQQEFYVVEFRSTLKQDYDGEQLSYLDKESHKEAIASGGLLKYWFGQANVDRRNLATCFWRNKEDAYRGGRGPRHRDARAVIAKAYQHIDIKGLRLVIKDGVEGWSIAPFA